jgi:UDP-GlcNAc:undecaprenyl-phosphate GlcNAc-1-phosphate transferase
MAISTILVGGRTSQSFSGQAYFFFAPIFIPLVILGVPILDTFLAIIRRASKRRGIAEADKDHLHHRLLRLGHTQQRSVFILWAWTALLSGLVLYPTYNHGKGNALIPIGVLALGLMLFTVLHPLHRKSRRTGAVAVDPRQATLPFDDPPLEIALPDATRPESHDADVAPPAAAPPAEPPPQVALVEPAAPTAAPKAPMPAPRRRSKAPTLHESA